MKTIVIPNTARSLFAIVRGFGPKVEGEALMFDRELPKGLVSVVAIVHTGLRASITGRQWWGSTNWSAARPFVAVMSLDLPIPHWCGLLSVEGDTNWDRLALMDKLEHPELFTACPTRG